MKNFKSFFTVLLVFSVFMVSCEKEESTLQEENFSSSEISQSLTDPESIENFVSSDDLLFDETAVLLVLKLDQDASVRSGNQSVIYTLGNEASGNEVIAFDRNRDGSISESGRYATNGTGTDGGLGNQGALALSSSGRLLFAVNPGSNDFSAFYVNNNGSLSLLDKINSGGELPVSIAFRHGLIYVLNAGGEGNISGFSFNGSGQLVPIPNSTRSLSSSTAGAAQVSFSNNGRVLIITEKATNTITTYAIQGNGSPSNNINTFPSAGATPFGFAIGNNNRFFVTEANGGAAGASTVSAYHVNNAGAVSLIDGPLATNTSGACWAVLTNNNKDLFVTNTGSNSVSSLTVSSSGQLDFGNNGNTTLSENGPLDAALDRTSKFLYVVASGGQQGDDAILSYRVGRNGELTQIDEDRGNLPTRLTGIVVR